MTNTFMNDSYKLLKLMYDNQITVLNKSFVPLTQMELSSELGFSKMKTNALFVDLQSKEYIVKVARGKYALSDKAIYIVDNIENIENTLEGWN